jgi:hypothetical protein
MPNDTSKEEDVLGDNKKIKFAQHIHMYIIVSYFKKLRDRVAF